MNQPGNILILIIMIAALSAGAFFYYQSKKPATPTNSYQTPITNPQPTGTNSEEQTKTFTSKSLKFSINTPSDFEILEKFTSVVLKSSKGEIIISRSGTNFDNIGGYLNDLTTKNTFIIDNRKVLEINGLDSIDGIVKNSSGNKKSYFIYAKGWVYTLSTFSQSLYDNLDQIAKSFKYTP